MNASGYGCASYGYGYGGYGSAGTYGISYEYGVSFRKGGGHLCLGPGLLRARVCVLAHNAFDAHKTHSHSTHTPTPHRNTHKQQYGCRPAPPTQDVQNITVMLAGSVVDCEVRRFWDSLEGGLISLPFSLV